jgi:hypothetical protein
MRPHVKAIVLCVNEALQVYMDESQVRPLVMEMSSPSAPSPHTPDPSACTPEDAQEACPLRLNCMVYWID